MTLLELITIASKGYPDDLILSAHLGEDVGDSLATFLANEIKETFEGETSEEQLANASMAVSRAMNELRQVEEALLNRLSVEQEITKIKETPVEELPLLLENLEYPEDTKHSLVSRLKGECPWKM